MDIELRNILRWPGKEKAKQQNRHRLALDLVEPGTEDNSYGKHERVTMHVPEGITSRLLYADIIRIAWPSFVEMTLTQLASMVDMMMVGQLGSWAITSVGLTTQPKFLLMSLFMAMNVGATALVARYKGEGSPEKANMILRQSLLLTFALSVIGSVLGFVYSENMIRFMGAAEAITLEQGTIYLKIQMAGFVTFALTSTLTATLRGVGNSRVSMMYNMTANVVNVVFNYIMIYGHFGFPKMGVAGASLATVIGQFVAFVLAMIAILRGNQYLHLRFKEGFKPNWNAMKSIFNIGMPALIEQVFMRAGMITYNKTVASLGTVAFATHNIAFNVQSMSFMNGQAFAVSATSLVGQSLGKKRPDMAQAYCSRTRRVGMMVSVVLALAFFFFGRYIVALYTSESDVIAQGAKILMFVALIQPLQSSQFILAGALRGAGDTRATAIITFITVMLIRPGFAIFAIHVLDWGLYGAWVALISDQLLRSILVLFRYNTGKWKSIKV